MNWRLVEAELESPVLIKSQICVYITENSVINLYVLLD